MPVVKIRWNSVEPGEDTPTFYILNEARHWEAFPDASGAPWDSIEESLGTHLLATFPDLFPA
jgi:hypothetical protein